MSAVRQLWERAARWRWLASAAVITTALLVYLELTPTYRPTPAQTASYDVMAQRAAPRTAAASAGATRPQSSQPAPITIVPGPAPAAPSGAPPVAPPAFTTGATSPRYVGPAPGSTVTFRSMRGQGEVSGGGLIAAYCCAGAFSTITASRAVSSGKHYYEMQLQTAKGERNPASWTNAGVVKEGERTGPARPGSQDTSTHHVIARGQSGRFKEGDVFMFGLDLDGGGFYYGVNGTWINGVPGRDAGLPLDKGASYIPFVNVSASSSNPDKDTDRWVANFGQQPFRYQWPSGYAPYAGRPPAVGATGAGGDQRTSPVAPGTSAGAGSGALMGKSFVDTMPIGGLRVPLPEGTWTVVAFQRGGQKSAGSEVAVLADITSKKQLAGLMAVHAFSDQNRAGSGFPPSSFCARSDYVMHDVRANDTRRQECWWINHAAQNWHQSGEMQAARAELQMRGVAMPDTMMNVGFRLSDPNRFVTVLVYFDPRGDGIQSTPSAWSESQWHRDRIGTFPEKLQYVRKLEGFGRSWIQIIRANF